MHMPFSMHTTGKGSIGILALGLLPSTAPTTTSTWSLLRRGAANS